MAQHRSSGLCSLVVSMLFVASLLSCTAPPAGLTVDPDALWRGEYPFRGLKRFSPHRMPLMNGPAIIIRNHVWMENQMRHRQGMHSGHTLGRRH